MTEIKVYEEKTARRQQRPKKRAIKPRARAASNGQYIIRFYATDFIYEFIKEL